MSLCSNLCSTTVMSPEFCPDINYAVPEIDPIIHCWPPVAFTEVGGPLWYPSAYPDLFCSAEHSLVWQSSPFPRHCKAIDSKVLKSMALSV